MPHARHAVSLLLLALAGTSCVAAVEEQVQYESLAIRTTLHAGVRSLDHSQFDSHPVYGVEVDVKPEGSRLGYEVGTSFATDSGTSSGVDVEGDFYEAYGGIRWHFPNFSDRAMPYVGAGASYFQADRQSEVGGIVTTAEDWSGGGYVRFGVYGPVGKLGLDGGSRVLAGGDLRAVFGQDYDWLQFTLTLGFAR